MDNNSIKKEYKESYYNFKLILKNQKLMLYNTKTGAISIFDEEEKEPVLKILNNPDDCLENQFIHELLKLGFIVKYDKNELDDIKLWNEAYVNYNKQIQLTLLPAEACNFKCPYCFIYKQRNIVMEDWVFDAVYKFLHKRIEENPGITSILLSWFGGEPLLASEKIIGFMIRLKDLKERYNIKISSSIITNGYLLTPALFEKLLENAIDEIQVTLDGNKETHDRLRTLNNGSPTFDIIFNNLTGISKTIDKGKDFDISIRANFLSTNIESMKKLIKRFEETFGEDKRFNIYFRPVYNFETTRNSITTLSHEICTMDEGLRLQNELTFEVKRLETGKGETPRIFDPLPQPRYSWCTEVRSNAYIIGADGSVFSCDTLITDKEKSLGEIKEDGNIVFNENVSLWKSPVLNIKDRFLDECTQCKLLPVCMGGCRRARLIEKEKPCFWTEEEILNSMEEYAILNAQKKLHEVLRVQ